MFTYESYHTRLTPPQRLAFAAREGSQAHAKSKFDFRREVPQEKEQARSTPSVRGDDVLLCVVKARVVVRNGRHKLSVRTKSRPMAA